MIAAKIEQVQSGSCHLRVEHMDHPSEEFGHFEVLDDSRGALLSTSVEMSLVTPLPQRAGYTALQQEVDVATNAA